MVVQGYVTKWVFTPIPVSAIVTRERREKTSPILWFYMVVYLQIKRSLNRLEVSPVWSGGICSDVTLPWVYF